jgi:Zn-dependent M28 family amino/carboxypeptidase
MSRHVQGLKGSIPAAWCALALLTTSALGAGEGPGDAFVHVEAFQAIADANGGNRAAGTPGYDRSADYVADRLRRAGYEVRFEEFTFPFFEDRAPPLLLAGSPHAATNPRDLRTFANSASGDVSAPIRSVDLGLAEGTAPGSSTSGCEASDFAGFPKGAIALMRRGTCTFQVKVDLAATAGAAGAVIMNEGTPDRTGPVSGRVEKASIPVLGVSFDLGRTLAATAAREPEGVVRLAVDVVSGTRSTRNVLAEWKGAPIGEVIVVGAHLDGVPEGPGINDNGSGAAAVLEAALRLAGQPPVEGPRLQFAFWGAEEVGLLGSRHHVDALSDEERKSIKVYVNLDMVASPNFARFVQATSDATGLVATASRIMVDAFRARGLAVEERARTGRRGFGSDDGSFARNGIPTLGLYTGAGEGKSSERAQLFGGVAGQPYDLCYHRACDTAQNINRTVLEQMTSVLTEVIGALRRDAA